MSRNGELNCVVNHDHFKCVGICIASREVHTIENKQEDTFVMLIEETSELSQILENRYLNGKPYAVIEESVLKNILSIEEADKQVLSQCAQFTPEKAAYDDRISDVLRQIESRESIEEHILSELCSVACLSQSRLSHLFREQVKISLASYLVMAKMKKVLQYVQNGENITEASVHAGFNGSSHFAATCKKMFGISFSDFLK